MNSALGQLAKTLAQRPLSYDEAQDEADEYRAAIAQTNPQPKGNNP